jgi:alpha-tubulin suppressor-like RCC1 family protein
VRVQASKPGAPGEVTAVGGDAKAVVSWSAPTENGGSAVTSYTATSSPGGKTATVLAPATSVTVPDLTNGTEYTFTVVATNAGGDSAASAPSAAVLVARAPDAPNGVTGVGANQRVSLTWIAPVSDGGSPVTQYTVTASPGGASVTVAAPATSATVTGLTNGTSYTFTVVATNAVGDSAASPASAAIQAIQTVPSAPSGVMAENTNASAQVQWTAPSDDGGSAITLYTVTASPGGITATAAPPATRLTVTGLTNGTTYTFSVVATNDTGDSASSEPSDAILVADDPPTGLTYSTNPANYKELVAITPNTPSIGGGPVVSYSVNPPLPSGLTLNAGTGVISGSPTTFELRTIHTITATNTGGSTTAQLDLTVLPRMKIDAADATVCSLQIEKLSCWGSNVFGQVGNDSTTDATSPVELTVFPNKVQDFTSGASHTCALSAGKVSCWGSNTFGELGDGTVTERHVPTPVSQLTGLPNGVEAITAGRRHTCALVGGNVWCWGDNGFGQLGDGTTVKRLNPVEVPGLSGVLQIEAGLDHTCARLADGLKCWGSGASGALGNGSQSSSSTPITVNGLPEGVVQTVSAGEDETCAVVGGGVWCWGSNLYGKLGSGAAEAYATSPVAVSGLNSGVRALSVGGDHVCALQGSTVWCWGHNDHGQIMGTADSSVPLEREILGGSSGTTELPMSALTAGTGPFSCSLRTSVWLEDPGYSWGRNDHGQLGDGTTTDRNYPVSFPSP